jgi:hypothetical protein
MSRRIHAQRPPSGAIPIAEEHRLNRFLHTLRTQRWDDHRYYHQSRINQALHLASALGFLVAYAVVFIDPALAALIAWGFSMTTRQAGHFFFEPKGYDHVNEASFKHKEAIKVGYNLERKVVLLAIWAAFPVALALSPSLGGVITPAVGLAGYIHDVGMGWFALGVAGVLFRTTQLLFVQGAVEALAWTTKIVTDPFHDVKMYWRAPLALLRGEWIDPMVHVRRGPH